VDLNAVYVAAKGSVPVGDQFSLYGKVGVAYHSQRFSDLNAVDGKYHKAKALLGAGAEWHLTEQVSLSAELVNYGTVRTKAGVIKARALQAGLSYKF
jgi:OOP family OmpA-OmpF porin